jgi:hypothetical protein
MRVGDPPATLNSDQVRVLRRLTRIARLLDSSIRIPGTRFRVGIDPLLGLIPGVGDFAAATLSTYIVVQAKRLGAPQPILARMAGNVVIDWLIGTVPLVGDIFDFGFKCNTRNIRLLEDWIHGHRRT